jgi:hypothetical protein
VRPALWFAAGATALAVVIAIAAILVLDPFSSSGDGVAGESPLQKTLREMVLQPDDLPPGLVTGDEAFITNDQAAQQSSADPEARGALLKKWGRLLGYEIAYEPAAGTPTSPPLQGVNVSASLYKTAEGAGASFADAVKTAEGTDWVANYAGLKEFQQEEIKAEGLADEIVWLRLSGIQSGTGGPDALVTDDLIFFRIGAERGFMRVLGNSTDTQDRAHLHSTVESWLQTLVGNVKVALADFEAGDGG